MQTIILMYHRINDFLDASNLICRPETFESHIKFLNESESINVISLKDFEQTPKDFYQKNKTNVIITIDDGYKDNYDNAYPILKKYNIPATIFLTTNMINTDNKFKRYQNINGRDMLNINEIREMGENNITFGPHTKNHLHLPQLNYEQQFEEIKESMTYLENNFPKEILVNTFCYPYGEYSTETLTIMHVLNFNFALTVNEGMNCTNTPIYELKRIGISGLDDIKSFKLKICEE